MRAGFPETGGSRRNAAVRFWRRPKAASASQSSALANPDGEDGVVAWVDPARLPLRVTGRIGLVSCFADSRIYSLSITRRETVPALSSPVAVNNPFRLGGATHQRFCGSNCFLRPLVTTVGRQHQFAESGSRR